MLRIFRKRFLDLVTTSLEMTKRRNANNLILNYTPLFHEFCEEFRPKLSLIRLGVIHWNHPFIEEAKSELPSNIFGYVCEVFSDVSVKNIE